MADIPILVAGQSRDITLDGTTYTLKAPSYGEVGAIDVELSVLNVPSQAVINDALITAARAAGRDDLADAIVALDDARDAISDFYASCPPSTDAEGQIRWRAENAEELRRLERPAQRLMEKRNIAQELFAQKDEVAELLRRVPVALQRRMVGTVAAGIAAIGGRPQMLSMPDVQALPIGHVRTLFELVSQMMVPSTDAAKNSSRPSTSPATPRDSASVSARKTGAGSRSGSGGAAKSNGRATRGTSSARPGRG
jgi:hypothetical protein